MIPRLHAHDQPDERRTRMANHHDHDIRDRSRTHLGQDSEGIDHYHELRGVGTTTSLPRTEERTTP